MRTLSRRKTPAVMIGSVLIGATHPIAIQSMTDTPTADIDATLRQTKELIDTGSEMVRWTINDKPAAQAVPEIVQRLEDGGYRVPIIGDFHYSGHELLRQFPRTAQALAKYRINPGNIGKGRRHDENFSNFIRIAREYNKPVRIGVNWGSLDEEVFTRLMSANARRSRPKDFRDVTSQAVIESALQSADYARKLGLKKNQIVLSVKMSHLPDMVKAYEGLAAKCDFALHLGLTEAGAGLDGIVASAAGLGILLRKGIGDTIRVSLTPQPGVPRSREVEVCKTLLQALGSRYFSPTVISCPGCGRTNREFFQKLSAEIRDAIHERTPHWRKIYPGVEQLKVAVMGCVVNGPGESRHAQIGISLPGSAEKPQSPVFIDGKKTIVLSGTDIAGKFLRIIEDYINEKYS